jgi:hypothetical protein
MQAQQQLQNANNKKGRKSSVNKSHQPSGRGGHKIGHTTKQQSTKMNATSKPAGAQAFVTSPFLSTAPAVTICYIEPNAFNNQLAMKEL